MLVDEASSRTKCDIHIFSSMLVADYNICILIECEVMLCGFVKLAQYPMSAISNQGSNLQPKNDIFPRIWKCHRGIHGTGQTHTLQNESYMKGCTLAISGTYETV